MPEPFNLPPLHTNRADFSNIRSRREFYVDKTRFFRDLLAVTGEWNRLYNEPPPLHHGHLFLARPRRFGKTLLINTLETWFQGLPPEHPASVAGVSGSSTQLATDLPEHWTSPAWLWDGLAGIEWHGTHGWHPVIRLDMGQAVNPNLGSLQDKLQACLWGAATLWRQRGVDWGNPDWEPPTRHDAPDVILSGLIRALGQHYKRSPAVLVDEYDATLVEFIGTDVDPSRALAELRQLYRVLKDDQGKLYCVFMTGITRFARNHLFSAVNNMTDISDMSAYGALCGFTEREVDRNLAPYRETLETLDPRFQEQDVLGEWRSFYNGYRFAPHPDTPRVYNPFSLLRSLDLALNSGDARERAAEGHWPSPWSESGHPGLLARLAADKNNPLPDTVREGNGFLFSTPEPGLANLTRPDFARLMLDTGYYTWHGGHNGASAYLNFPNREVAESWTYDILGLWEHAPERDGSLISDLKAFLAAKDVSGFCQRLENFIFGISHVNLQGEASFRTLLQALLMQMDFPTQSEKSTLGGRSDHEIQVGNRVYVFEVKYNRPVTEARNQIRDRQYGREYVGTGLDMVAVSLSFRQDLKAGPRLEWKTDDLAELLTDHEESTLPDRNGPYLGPE